MIADTVLTDPTQWMGLQAALDRMVTDRSVHIPGSHRDPNESGLLRTASRRGMQSSEYAKVLNNPAMRTELTTQMDGAAK